MAETNQFGSFGGGLKDMGAGAGPATAKKSVKASKLARMTEEEKVREL